MASSGCPAETGWRAEINAKRPGATYFLAQGGRLRFDPAEYIEYRSLERESSVTLRREWAKWLRDLNNSSFEHVRRTAAAARRMTQDHLDNYYIDRIVKKRKLDVLESAAEQLAYADRELTALLAVRSAKIPPATVVAVSKSTNTEMPNAVEEGVERQND
ncbi:hypothetical protein EMPS_08189 [Entomortierella parvispora]|uniref:Uncharacterized protein n=1 Tax=Entomortierella parvispora TaxID=205924 RepID=A0A9P3HFX2_9FUNG|nr:hypothetical protein EMPS_08189 [Entomortierella parvispora]